ncbi:hypothetical protein ACFZB9_26805 [Kitasatospora sp. NPDC008050]|uniref:MmyB family transcriptional regulator n=1 Tax=Kitasatospora sp. NPDC008050 TaxID=3364021 RepID=UPI0036E8581F
MIPPPARLTARPGGELTAPASASSRDRRSLHPVVGTLELDCEVLAGSGERQLLVVYTARPGSDTAGRLELLRVVGRQQLTGQLS